MEKFDQGSTEDQKKLSQLPGDHDQSEEKNVVDATSKLENLDSSRSINSIWLLFRRMLQGAEIGLSEKAIMHFTEEIEEIMKKIDAAKFKDSLLLQFEDPELLGTNAKDMWVSVVHGLSRVLNASIYERINNIQDKDINQRISQSFIKVCEVFQPILNDVFRDPIFLNQIKKVIDFDKIEQTHDLFHSESKLGDFGLDIDSFISSSDMFMDVMGRLNMYKLLNSEHCFDSSERISGYKAETIGLVAEYGNKNQIKILEDLVFKSFQEGNEFISKISKNNNTYISEIIIKEFHLIKVWFQGEYGFKLNDITKDQQILSGQWPEVIKGIIEMEKLRKGSAKMLSDKFGIHMFNRYSPSLLLEQLDQEELQAPYGILVYAYDDHNDAFRKSNFWPPITIDQLKQNGMTTRIIEAGSGFDLMRKIARLNSKYGDQNKISFLILNAHGQEESFLLSVNNSSNETVNSVDFEGKGTKRMKDYFTEHPEIVLLSCSTGAKGGIGEKIADTFDAHVIAPNKPTGVKSVEVSFTEPLKPSFTVNFNDRSDLEQYNLK